MMTGWECPRCHRCWSPTVSRCAYCGPEKVCYLGKPTEADLLKNDAHQSVNVSTTLIDEAWSPTWSRGYRFESQD